MSVARNRDPVDPATEYVEASSVDRDVEPACPTRPHPADVAFFAACLERLGCGVDAGAPGVTLVLGVSSGGTFRLAGRVATRRAT